MHSFLRGFFGIILFACFSLSHALEREFPESAKRGLMQTAWFPEVIINGQKRYLAANIQVRNAENQIQTINTLDETYKYLINYQENEAGEIYRIWILTADEARHPAKQGPEPGYTRRQF